MSWSFRIFNRPEPWFWRQFLREGRGQQSARVGLRAGAMMAESESDIPVSDSNFINFSIDAHENNIKYIWRVAKMMEWWGFINFYE